jgi:hypothetical protein
MQDSDVAYIKAMLWGILGVCQGSELSDPMFWMIFLNVLLYGFGFIFYRWKENGEG